MTSVRLKLAALLIAVPLAGGLCIRLGPRGRATAAEPAPAATPLKAGLKNGVSVEFLGMVQGMVVRDRWLPDGTPDEHPLFAKARFERSKVIHAPEEHPRPGVGVVVRFNLKLPDGSLATSASEQWFCTALDADGEPIDGLVVLYGMAKERGKTATVRFRFATGPWEATGVRAAAEELGGSKDGIEFGKAESLRGGTYLALTAANDRWAKFGQGVLRLCARDAGGKTRVALRFQCRGEGPPAPTECGFLFEDAAPADLQEFWIERRTVDEWIEFRNVAFESGLKTEVKIVTSDNVPEEPGGEGL
jgi:hypothetical protein